MAFALLLGAAQLRVLFPLVVRPRVVYLVRGAALL
jgi:hypothetical protein